MRRYCLLLKCWHSNAFHDKLTHVVQLSLCYSYAQQRHCRSSV